MVVKKSSHKNGKSPKVSIIEDCRRLDGVETVDLSISGPFDAAELPGVKNDSGEVPEAAFQEERPTEEGVRRYFEGSEAQLEAGDPPLHSRKQKLARRGLPNRENLAKLARVWLESSHEFWPELVKVGVIPAVDDYSVNQLVEQFEWRFIQSQVIEFKLPKAAQKYVTKLAAGYIRYSADNSNPRSLDDQLRLQLRKPRWLSWYPQVHIRA